MHRSAKAGRIREELAAVLGPLGLVAPDNEERFLVDERGKFGAPALAVVRPETTEQAAAVVTICSANGLAVIPQGGNTGLCGGSVPGPEPGSRPSVVVSLNRLRRIRDINAISAVATVEAGVTVQELQEAAQAVGLLFAPDWAARGTAQIGGAVSTNAGGLNVIRWGTFRDQMLGLEVVLPDGRIWDGLRSLRKDASGLDLKQLFIGAEGTLGLVTAATIKLHPRPEQQCTAMAALPSLQALLPLFALVRDNTDGYLSGFELMPHEGLERVARDMPSVQVPEVTPSAWYVLIRFSGDASARERLSGSLHGAHDEGLIVDAAVAASTAQESNLWLLRDELPSGRRFDHRGRRHKFDIALPVDAVVDFITDAEAAVDQIVPGARPYVFGHVGDGNLHFSLYPAAGTDLDLFDQRGEDMVAAVDRLTWRYGGSISAEHGIGQEMRDRVAGQKSAVEFELMARVKQALDPGNIMNPGKVLPDRWMG